MIRGSRVPRQRGGCPRDAVRSALRILIRSISANGKAPPRSCRGGAFLRLGYLLLHHRPPPGPVPKPAAVRPHVASAVLLLGHRPSGVTAERALQDHRRKRRRCHALALE